MTDRSPARHITGTRKAADTTLELIAAAAAAGLAPCAEPGPRPGTYAIRLDNRASGSQGRITGLIVIGSITGRPRRATITRAGQAATYRAGQIRDALTDCLSPVADD